jgi:pimeloyl-ACP methyl ester carboxylesterase/DNA-binding CsgD family transcriptional regulator
MGWVSHLDFFWVEPRFARFLRRLSSFARLILFDKRGTGLSDRVPGYPTMEERMDDVRAVMDAAGSERAAVLGISEGGPMCALFAATHPQRTAALIVIGGYARRLWAPDYPHGAARDDRMQFIADLEREWGNDTLLNVRAPSMANDARFREWWRTYLRMSASPGAAVALTRMNMEIDVREVLPTIHVPTLIIHRTGDATVPVGNGQYLAEHIPGARFVELPGDDHLPFVGDQDQILREVELFLTGMLPAPEPDRVLATLLITGIAGAAAIAERVGDHRWGEIVAAHDAMVRERLERFRGSEVRKTIGGFLATFDGPARAIRCASEITDGARELGLTVRAGLHAGECEVVDGDIGGVAVQIAERVFEQASPGEVVVSSTVKDLVTGSGIAFEDKDARLLTGAAGGWRLHRVVPERSQARSVAPTAIAEMEAARPPAVLSPREREVAVLIARGLSNRQVADDLSISPATVERHVTNILGKLGFHSRAQVAAWAVGHDLLSLSPG